jgi:hypothetical protein
MLRGIPGRASWSPVASSHITGDDGSSVEHRNDGAARVQRVIKTIYNLTKGYLGRAQRSAAWSATKSTPLAVYLQLIRKSSVSPRRARQSATVEIEFYREQSLQRLHSNSSSASKRRWLLRVKASRQRQANLIDQQPRITRLQTTAAPTTTSSQPKIPTGTSTNPPHKIKTDENNPAMIRRKSTRKDP